MVLAEIDMALEPWPRETGILSNYLQTKTSSDIPTPTKSE